MVNLSQIGNNIKNRKVANDVFLTPLKLAKKAIDMVGVVDGKWLDPFKATGNYYNQFPTENKDYTEISEGLDFFDYDKPVDIICSNPPFSIMNKVLEHSVKLKPKIISYIMGVVNLTPKRMEYMNANGYFITKMHITRVNAWFSNTIIVQFEKDAKSNVVSFDREKW